MYQLIDAIMRYNSLLGANNHVYGALCSAYVPII